jgi:uncharacterized protein YcfJ
MHLTQTYKYLKVCRMFKILLVVTKVDKRVCMCYSTSPKMVPYHVKFVYNLNNK